MSEYNKYPSCMIYLDILFNKYAWGIVDFFEYSGQNEFIYREKEWNSDYLNVGCKMQYIFYLAKLHTVKSNIK